MQPGQVPVLDGAALPQDAVARQAGHEILEHGVVKLVRAVPPAAIAGWRAQFETQVLGAVARGKYRHPGRTFGPGRTQYILDIHQRFNDPAFYASPLVYAVSRLLLENGFILFTATIANAVPGAGTQQAHRDQRLPSGNEKLNGILPPLSLTVSIPLVETREAAGATAFLLRSHRLQDLPQSPHFVMLGSKPGDCMIWDSRVFNFHCANRSDTAIPTVLLYYQRPWFLNIDNYTPGCELQMSARNLARVPPQFRHLFDWSRVLFTPPEYRADADGNCDCGAGLPFAACHGAD